MTSIQVKADLQSEKMQSSERRPLLSSREGSTCFGEKSKLRDNLERKAWWVRGYMLTCTPVGNSHLVVVCMRLINKVDMLSKAENRRRWISIYIIYFTMFLAAVTFSIVLSSLWPYLQQIDKVHSTTSFLGWVVAAYSAGQLVASPLFGLWADHRPTREPLLVSLMINVVFNLLYCYAGAFPLGVSGWILIVSRTLIGFSAGSTAVVRSYVSEATTLEERTGAMTGISASQALGFILGPALGLAFVPLGGEGFAIEAIKLELNMYTGPGYLSALLGTVNAILLVVLFKEMKLTPGNRRPEESTNIQDSISPLRKHYDRLAAVVAILLFFVVLFVFSVFETVAIPLSMDEFAWTRKEALLYNDLFFGGLAVLAIVTFISVKFLSKVVDERVMFMVGLFLVAFGFFALLPMSNELPEIATSTLELPNGTSEANASSPESVGCRVSSQPWCTHIPKIYIFQYAICLVLVAVGYPAASVLCYTIYSKLLGPFRQGMMMGWLTASGSLARTLGPIFVSSLYHHVGPLITFSTVDGIIAASIVLLLVSGHRLVPYRPSTLFTSTL